MKTKKFFMTSLLVMGMIIAKAANGFAPELVLVSQPVLTYNANSVTVYYDLQNIGDYTYKGDIYLYLDPDNGYYYAKQYVRICSGRIRRVALTIPAYRPNPSWTYTVMPYYELGDDLYSFTTFEYFEPVRFCWHGYHDEPWVVIHVPARPRHYYRPGEYRYYYDGYRPMMPPPPPGEPGYAVAPPPGGPGMPPMNPMHHTYGYHHNNGGYPANYHPNVPTPGYNHFTPEEPHTHNGGPTNNEATVAPHGSHTPGSMSSNSAGNNNNTTTNNGGATTRPGTNVNNDNNTGTNNSGNATTRPSGNNNGGRTDNNSGNVSRPNNNSNNSGNSGRSGNNSNSGRVNNGNSRGNNSNNQGSNTRGNRSNRSNSSSRGNNNSNSSSRGGNNTPSRSR